MKANFTLILKQMSFQIFPVHTIDFTESIISDFLKIAKMFIIIMFYILFRNRFLNPSI
ncbi:hypothetical protein C1645_765819 [Glomus cerebriforme]|uniref:Uncharacterized protein n=1 Tax=Glomus cerebriforme TaxID=658196 RepID=A0A397TB29_9GLOM|nr:hypothetical protein C1645_765819 [Glomus cerebriforme]